ncbi:MAG: SDR family oxidoreductase [Mesorhizobium sp.]
MQITAGDTAFITGGASGIGLGMAEAFGAAGVRVIIADINSSALGEAENALRAHGIEASSVVLDVARPDNWQEALKVAGPVDILCNNAGVAQARITFDKHLEMVDLPLPLWQMMMDVNINGVFLGMKTFAPAMIERGRGHIVNTASMAGLLAPGGLSAYIASKFAVMGLSESAAAELAPRGVGMSILCPGGVQSNLVANTASMRARLPDMNDGKVKELITAPLPHAPKMSPRKVGDRVLKAIQDDELFIITHPEYDVLIEERFAAVRAAIGASAEPGYLDTPAMLERSRNQVYVDQAGRVCGRAAE